jgi:hypothetical protein
MWSFFNGLEKYLISFDTVSIFPVLFLNAYIFLKSKICKSVSNFSYVLLIICSYIWAFSGIIAGGLTVLEFWGFIGFFIGVLLLGIGFVPLGIIASLINRQWSVSLVILIMGLGGFFIRFFAVLLRQYGENRAQNKKKPIVEIFE